MSHGPTVLHLVPSFTGGGAERQLALLATALRRAGASVHVGYVHEGVNLPLLEGRVDGLHRIPCAGNHDPMLLLKVVRLISRVRPHLVQTWLTQMDVLGGLAARVTEVPHVLSERNSALAYPRGWKTNLRKWVGKHAAAIVANSEDGRAYWRAAGATGDLAVIRNGVVFRQGEVVTADPTVVGFAAGCRIILFAGRLVAAKNVRVLLEAADQVLSAEPAACLLMLGEGPLRNDIEAHILQSRHVGRIRLMGYSPDIFSWMKSASVLVAPSLWEGSPNVVIEAMASECPLVLSDIQAHREIVGDDGARFCDARSADSVAEAALNVLRNPREAKVRATRALARVSVYSIEHAAQQYMSLYEEVCRRFNPE